ncbi:hypothetical protein NUM3379_09590 [Kineococcus sp. NUM-3379]
MALRARSARRYVPSHRAAAAPPPLARTARRALGPVLVLCTTAGLVGAASGTAAGGQPRDRVAGHRAQAQAFQEDLERAAREGRVAAQQDAAARLWSREAGRRAARDARLAEQARLEEEARRAEAARLAEEARRADAAEAARSAERDPRGAARILAAERGWGEEQFSCLDKLWTKESGWDPSADNPTSSAYGIPQALPGKKMASEGEDWETNPLTQIRWGLGYIEGRYGSPCAAWGHSRSHNWY